jgi:hypothetical protein
MKAKNGQNVAFIHSGADPDFVGPEAYAILGALF